MVILNLYIAPDGQTDGENISGQILYRLSSLFWDLLAKALDDNFIYH